MLATQDWGSEFRSPADIKSQVVGKVLAQGPQDQVFSTKEIYLPQRNKGQGIRDKDNRYGAGGGEVNKRDQGRAIYLGGQTKDCLWMGETDAGHRQMANYQGTRENP